MFSVRHSVREFLVLTMVLLIWGAVASGSLGQVADKKGQKSEAESAKEATTSPSESAASDSSGGAAKEDGEKPKAAPATKPRSLLRAIMPAAKSTNSASKKTQEEARRKAIEDARAAYEKQKRELQERLKNDPLWQPSHEQVSIIKVNEFAKGRAVHSFCLNGEGNLLVCCGGKAAGRGMVMPAKTNARAEEVAEPGTILILSADGKKLGSWKMDFEPQAICLADDGTVYVGGAGKLAKPDSDGKPTLTVDAPNVAELPPLPPLPEKKAEPQGKEAEEAEKAKQEKIAKLRKEVQEARKEFQKVLKEAAKDLKPNDEAAMKAYQAKVQGPLEKYRTLQEELTDLQTTPEMRAMRLRAERERQLTITGMAVTDQDVFVVCRSAKGYGYDVWRTDRDLKEPKKIVKKLAGCCGQMDIQARDGELWVAHNARHKVEHYDRDGKKLSSFGKTDRTNADGFGGCCEPKNLRFVSNGELFAAESGPPTCVKRFTTDGKFLGVMVMAPWQSGCVRVTTLYAADADRFFVLNSGERTIHVFAKKPAKAPSAEPATDDDKAKEEDAAQPQGVLVPVPID